MSKTKSSTPSVTARRRKAKEPITAHEALSMLESAVSYCQQAGLNIGAANGEGGTLGLFIPNAHYVLTDSGTRAAFRLGAVGVSAHDAGSIGTERASASVSAHAGAME